MTTTAAPPPDATLTVTMTDGVAIDVRRYGIGRGPCLVLSHGNGFAIDGYRVFWAPLAERYELALFDLRNHGRNAPSGTDRHTYSQFATDIATIQQALRARLAPRQKLVGVFHSASARSAMKHAVEMGGAWDALVQYDPPNVPPRGHALYEPMRAFELRLVDFACNRPDRFDGPDAMVASYRESRAASRWLPQAVEDMGRAVVRHDPVVGWTLACRRELEAAIYLAALNLDLWPRAADFRFPVKLIGADPDLKGNAPTALANQVLAREHGYDYAAVPGTGHLLQVERPEECRQVMTAWLEDIGIR